MDGDELRLKPIVTPRLVLRPIDNGDMADLNRLRADCEVLKTTYDNPARFNTPDDWFVKNMHDPENPFYLIVLRSSLQSIIIGYVCTRFSHDIGYMVGRPYWGQGYATEAANAYMQRYWELFPTRKSLAAGCDKTNIGSRKVLEKVGFTEVEAKLVYPNGFPEMGIAFKVDRPRK